MSSIGDVLLRPDEKLNSEVLCHAGTVAWAEVVALTFWLRYMIFKKKVPQTLINKASAAIKKEVF